MYLLYWVLLGCGIEREMKKFYRNIYYLLERYFENLDMSFILYFENKFGGILYC